jgi:hypothetical protein
MDHWELSKKMQAVCQIRFVLVVVLGILAIPNWGIALDSSPEPATVNCPATPTSLSAMRDCYRPLLLFAPSMNHTEFAHQLDELRAHASEVKERDIMVVPVVSNDTVSSHLPTDLPIIALSQSEVAAARSRFKVSCASFRVVLIGKDGSPKLSSDDLVSFDKLSALIDAMPMRKREIKQRSQRAGQ